MAITQSYHQGMKPAFRSPIALPVRTFLDLAAWMRRRRQMRASAVLLDSFDDRMLADIGLRRDRAGRPAVPRL